MQLGLAAIAAEEVLAAQSALRRLNADPARNPRSRFPPLSETRAKALD